MLVPMFAPLLGLLAAPGLWAPADGPAFPFEVRDLSGRRLRSADLEGKVVVIDFWASWCAPCRREFPDLAGYHERIKGRRDVAFLSFNVDVDPILRSGFLDQQKPPFPVYDAKDLRHVFGAESLPMKLIVDMRPGAPGRMCFRKTGVTTSASIAAQVNVVLAGVGRRRARP